MERPSNLIDTHEVVGASAAEVRPIPVTRTFLPDLAAYTELMRGVWERGWLTNHGPLVKDLENRLREYLNAPDLFVLNNGTVALQIGIKALDLRDEVIVTPFSYVATVSSAVWENCTPVFADIDPVHLTIDPKAVERAITPRTTGILATHVFGVPCATEELQDIADRHGLRILYDGAHVFGVRYLDRPITAYGDVTTLSFHATKLFHTIEGGAVIARNAEIGHKLSYMRNFGHNGPEAFQGIGINGKMSEAHAAMGHLVLDSMDHIARSRKYSWEAYRDALGDITALELLHVREGTDYNHAYFPVVFDTEARLLKVREALRAEHIEPRRYFYPSLDTLPYVVSEACAVSRYIAQRVLCLPLFADMHPELVPRIAGIVRAGL